MQAERSAFRRSQYVFAIALALAIIAYFAGLAGIFVVTDRGLIPPLAMPFLMLAWTAIVYVLGDRLSVRASDSVLRNAGLEP